MSEATRTVIADDHPRMRSSTRRTLEGSGFEVVGEAADASQAVAATLRHRPELCLLDVHMPGSGIRAAAEVSVACPETLVVMYTVSEDDDDLFGALTAGAHGYLLKDTDPERLPLALKGMLAGETAMPRHLVSRVISQFRQRGMRQRPRGPATRLSEREWDVIELLRQGLTTAEIADRLYVAPVTVRTHMSSILRKLEVPDRRAALRVIDGG